MIHLFAIVFSKGSVLPAVALATAAVVICWALWWGSVLTFAWAGTPLAAWAVAIGYAVFLGLSVPNEDHVRSSVAFLVAAALIFGMWAQVVLDAQYGFGFQWLMAAALIVITLAPAIVIIADVIREQQGADRQTTITALAAAVSGYLIVMQFVAQVLNHALGQLPWRVLGIPRVPQAEPGWMVARVLDHSLDRVPWRVFGIPGIPQPEPGWFALFGWKEVVSTVIAGLGLAFIVASSFAAQARESSPPYQDLLLPHIAAAQARLAQYSSAMSQAAEHANITVLHITRIVALAAIFIAMVIRRVVLILVDSARRLAMAVLAAIRWLALPVACFSVASLLLIAMVQRGLAEYDAGLPGAYSGPALWGGIVCAGVITVGLCALAFGLNEIDRTEPISLNVIMPAMVVTWLFYLIITVCEPILVGIGHGLHGVGKHVTALEFGPMTLINLIYVIVSFLLIAIPSLATIRSNPTAQNQQSTLVRAGLIGACLLTVVLALLYGHGPFTSWFATIL
jgi:hypothetical protein